MTAGHTYILKACFYSESHTGFFDIYLEKKILFGDVNGDGDVTAKDATLLRRYLAEGWNVTIDLTAADVNGDSDVTAKDVTLLRRYLAGGWGVTLG